MSTPTTTTPATTGRPRSPGTVALTLVADAAAVIAFAAVGRSSHAEGLTLAGLSGTTWPFLLAAAAGWALSRVWRRPLATSTGAVVWAVTVVGGVLLRVVAGQDAPLAFVVVTTLVLGALLLGWRLVAAAVLARRAR